MVDKGLSKEIVGEAGAPSSSLQGQPLVQLAAEGQTGDLQYHADAVDTGDHLVQLHVVQMDLQTQQLGAAAVPCS